MELHTQHDVILAMKKIKEQRNLSLAQIKKMVDKTPMDGQTVSLSLTTIRRVFEDGSEDRSFNYKGTIRPIANALNVAHGIESKEDILARCAMLEAVAKLKHERIEELEAEISRMTKDQLDKCGECHKLQERWDRQITLKDERIDRKDRQIDVLNDQIKEHQAREDRLLNIILSKFESEDKK